MVECIGPSKSWKCEARGCNETKTDLIQIQYGNYKDLDPKFLCPKCWNKWLKKNYPEKLASLGENNPEKLDSLGE